MDTADFRSLYQSQAVETAGPAQLVLMLYDGALEAVGKAVAALSDEPRPGRLELVHRELRRAQDILTELSLTLDTDRGGAVATGLASLYDFCLDRLVSANVRKDAAGLGAVTSVLTQLRDAWAEACCGAVPALAQR